MDRPWPPSIRILEADVRVGIVGAIVGALLSPLLSWLSSVVTGIPWSVPTIAVFVAIAAVVGVTWRRYRALRHALNTMNNIINADNSLLRLLPSLVASTDREGEIQKLLVEILRDATRAFHGEVHRASILVPDPDDERNYLISWLLYQMPPATEGSTRRFYIGDQKDRKRGVAGETFVDGKLRVVHVLIRDNGWATDDENYTNLNPDRPFPPYRSFVCVPIIGPAADCLGVVCFDSPNPSVFDPPATQNLLLVFGRRIAAALLTYRNLQHVETGKKDGLNVWR